jgi:Anp1
MHDLRGGAELVRLDSVGGTLLFVRAECHRNGLVFPPYYYGRPNPAARPAIWHRPPSEPGEIETEGMALMAYDMGYDCWGVPGLEIKHAPLLF